MTTLIKNVEEILASDSLRFGILSSEHKQKGIIAPRTNIDRTSITMVLQTIRSIVIGVDCYESLSPDKKLKGPEDDAKEIADKLATDDAFKKIGSSYRLTGEDASHAKIHEAIKDAFRYDGSQEPDLILFYYSGHIFLDKFGRAYIAPYDIDFHAPFVKGISIGEIGYFIHQSKIKSRIIVVLDCCYNNFTVTENEIPKFYSQDQFDLDFCSGFEDKIRLLSVKADLNSKEILRCTHADKGVHDHGRLSFHFITALEMGKMDMDKVIEYVEKRLQCEGELEPILLPKERICYVIMPFGKTIKKRTEEYWSFFYENMLRHCLEEYPSQLEQDYSRKWIRYKCTRSEPGPSNIMKGVLENLVRADLVVGVLTDKNANVWYELGIRHALQKRAIMIMEDKQKLPFDISQYGVVTYNNKIIGNSIIKRIISRLLRKVVPLNTENDISQILNHQFLGINNDVKNQNPDNKQKEAKDRLKKKYLRIKGHKYKGIVPIEEYLNFRAKLQIFSQETEIVVDSPVIEFVKSDTNITLIASEEEILDGESLEIRAEVKRKDGIPLSDIKVVFALTDYKLAYFENEGLKKTDNMGVVYTKIKGRTHEGTADGFTSVIAMATIDTNTKIVDNKTIKVSRVVSHG